MKGKGESSLASGFASLGVSRGRESDEKGYVKMRVICVDY